MGNIKDIVEINGKQYDARTGHLVKAAEPVPKIRPSGVEGFVKPNAAKLNRKPPQALRRKPERPHTLMRHVVPKPSIKPAGNEAPRVLTQQIRTANDIKRQKRANNFIKSQLVKKYGTSSDFVTQKPTPKPILKDRNHKQPAQPKTQQPRPQPVEGPFERSMRQSRSHAEEQPKRSKMHHRLAKRLRISPRLVSAGALVAAFLVFGGFFAYQNVSNLKVRYASMRADVDGKLPGYQPAGFTLNGPVQYSPGQITLSYRSNSDDRAFNVTQKASNWDSAALLNEYVEYKQNLVQTVEDNGKTIYVYGENNATWVDSGVWYQVEGQAALSSDQLLRIARSL